MMSTRIVMFIWERLLRRGDGEQFALGWHRRSASLLAAAGALTWLIRFRCPGWKGWGTLLYALARPADSEREEV